MKLFFPSFLLPLLGLDCMFKREGEGKQNANDRCGVKNEGKGLKEGGRKVMRSRLKNP